MVKAKWGTKRICQECGTKFYDMRRAEIICPKCEAGFQTAPRKPKRVRPVAKESVEEAKPAVKPAEAFAVVPGDGETAEIDGLEGVGTGDDEDDDVDDGDEDIIEDTSDLGDDDDDMAEVIQKPKAQGES